MIRSLAGFLQSAATKVPPPNRMKFTIQQSVLRSMILPHNITYSTGNSKDIADLQQIEDNLFENSKYNDSPADASQLLKQFKKPKRQFVARKSTEHVPRVKGVADKEEPSKSTPVKSSIIFNETLQVSYTKLHLHDPWLNTLLLSAKSKKYRSINHQLLIEGRRLIIDALSSGLTLSHIIFSQLENLVSIKKHLPSNTKIIKVPQNDLSFWSNLTTCPGLIAIFKLPDDLNSMWQNCRGLPITVICDQIREPNNIGSIIRNCAAIPCAQVILTKGCADPWETKALRSGVGGHFLVPIKGPLEWSSITDILPEMYSVYIAENNLENISKNVNSNLVSSYGDVSFDLCHNVLIIGGETHGISDEAFSLLKRNKYGKCLHIPMAKGVDSLNTASVLAVLLFEMKKQLLTSQHVTVLTNENPV